MNGWAEYLLSEVLKPDIPVVGQEVPGSNMLRDTLFRVGDCISHDDKVWQVTYAGDYQTARVRFLPAAARRPRI